MRDKSTPDQTLAALAARQHGVVAARQLGMSKDAIARRVASGRLHRIHWGVYAVGHPLLSRHGAWLAAVLAAGPQAVLSHATAAALWGIRATNAAKVDVTVSRTSGVRSTKRIRVHRPRRPPQRTIHEGIPTTTPMQTLSDLATILTRPALERAAEAAEGLRLVDGPLDLELGNPTRSPLEARFLELSHDLGIPRPLVNSMVEGFEVDLCWPEHRLIVEADSLRHHGTRAAFERDRLRDAHLTAAGWRVLRATDRGMHEIAGVVLSLIARSRSPSTP
jgi:Protein of unknown function (DUF559)/Transcriptional regulator, AbiEi antitoxin